MITKIEADSWQNSFDASTQQTALSNIEQGGIVFLPSLKFKLLTHEQKFLSDVYADPKSKNISFDIKTNILRGSQGTSDDLVELKTMIERFANHARSLINGLFPYYQKNIRDGKTSFRPVLTENRKVKSIRKDDSKLHIDSFASQPVHGLRLLRVFSNVNPHLPRVWKVGEPFENVADWFLPRISHRQWISPHLLQMIGVTKGVRSLYDHLMLQIHDSMKQDSDYQKTAPQQEVSFSSNTSWVVMTDKVSHAALLGQFLLEHTFYLPVEAMQKSELSPLRILERKTGKQLI